MVKFIVGENASGKTAFLKSQFKRVIESHPNYISNMGDASIYYQLPLNEDRIRFFADLLFAEAIYDEHDILFKGGPIKLSLPCLTLVHLLCRDTECILLDEPERDIPQSELGYIYEFLQRYSEELTECYIVTHSELLVQMLGAEYYKVVEEDNAFVLKQITRGEAYAIAY